MDTMDFWGWTGAVAYILAYLLLSLQVISARKYLFHLLNAVGGVCLIINALKLSDYPNILVNVAWVIIAGIAMVKLRNSRGQR